jgi:hypothetical protein
MPISGWDFSIKMWTVSQVILQAVRRWLVTAEPRVQHRVTYLRFVVEEMAIIKVLFIVSRYFNIKQPH